MIRGSMIRGTTPTHTFGLPISKEDIKNITVTYKQDDRIIVEKGIDDVEIIGNKVKVTLTQQETLRFVAGIRAKAKIGVLGINGKKLSSKRSVNIKVYDGNNEEVLT